MEEAEKIAHVHLQEEEKTPITKKSAKRSREEPNEEKQKKEEPTTKEHKVQSPVDYAYSEWYYRARTKYPALKSKDVVRRVITRWQGKSALSGVQEDRMRVRLYDAPTEANLILVTKDEARILDKTGTHPLMTEEWKETMKKLL